MLGAILGGAQLLGSLFGGAGKGAAAERQSQNEFLQRENQMKLGQYSTQQQALLSLLGLDESALMNRAKLGIEAPSARTKQAVLGSLLSRLQPTQVQAPAGIRVPQVSGGLRDALGGAGMRGAGNLLQLQALKALASKSDVPAPTNYAQRGMLPAPQMQGYKQAGKGESLLSMLGLAGGVAGALGGMMNRQTSQPNTLMAQQNMNMVPYRG